MTDVASELGKGPSKKIQLVMPEGDYEFLKALAAEAGVTQGFALHTLFEMLVLIVGTSKESAAVDEETRMPALELFVARIMHLMGLLGDAEFQRTVMLADAMGGERVNMRLQGLAAFANERLDQLKPIWEQARKEAAARKAAEWDPQVAALRQSIAANVGRQMVELENETT